MHVKTRALFVARIFDILAWIVLGLGALAALFVLAAGLYGFGTGNGFQPLVWGLFGAVLVLAYTAISWASVTLGAIIAGYIAQRSEV